MFAACAKQVDFYPVCQHEIRLHATIDSKNTKSYICFDGTYEWSPNDAIGVFGNKSNNDFFEYKSKSVFIGFVPDAEDSLKYAYYPYSEQVEFKDSIFIFNISKEQRAENGNNAPMFGNIQNSSIKFRYLGGVLCLRLAGSWGCFDRVSIVSEGEKSPCLSGTAVVNNIYADNCIYEIENGSKEIAYEFNVRSNINLLYVPLQVGEYEKLHVRIYRKGELLADRSMSNFIVERSQFILPPVINLSDRIYSFDISDSLFKNTPWNSGTLFSNGLLLFQREYDNHFREYVLSDISKMNSENNIITVCVDSEDIIRNIYTNNSTYFFSYKDDSEYFDIIVVPDDGGKTTIQNCTLNTEAKTKTIDSPQHQILRRLDALFQDNYIEAYNDNGVDNPSTLIEEVNTLETLEGVAGDYVGLGTPDSPLEAVNTSLGIAVSIIHAEYVAIQGGRYNACFGTDTYPVLDRVSIAEDGRLYVEHHIHEGAGNTGSHAEDHVVYDLLILQLPANYRVGNAMRIYETTEGVQKKDLRHYKNQAKGEPIDLYPQGEYQYVIRSVYGSKYDVTRNYSQQLLLQVDRVSIEELSVSRGEYIDGSFIFNVDYRANLSLENQTYHFCVYHTPSYGDGSRESEIYTSTSGTIKLVLDKWRIGRDKRAHGTWEFQWVNSTDGIFPSSFAMPLNLEVDYDLDYALKMDVALIGEPVKMGTKADNNDEEVYYVDYEVSVTVEGSGWIDCIHICDSNGKEIACEKPKKDGVYKYYGRSVYSNVMPPPLILCEGVLASDRKSFDKQSISLADLL